MQPRISLNPCQNSLPCLKIRLLNLTRSGQRGCNSRGMSHHYLRVLSCDVRLAVIHRLSEVVAQLPIGGAGVWGKAGIAIREADDLATGRPTAKSACSRYRYQYPLRQRLDRGTVNHFAICCEH